MLMGSGSLRAVYRHPESEGSCIKIERAPPKTYRRWLTPWRRSPHLGANKREILGYRQLMAKLPNRPAYLSWVGDLVETNLGPGLVVENINPSGRPMFCLNKIGKKKGRNALPSDALVSELGTQVAMLISDIKKSGMMTHCVAPESVWFVRGDEGYTMRIVDYKTVVSSTWSPFSRKRSWRWRRHFGRRLLRPLGIAT
jgi:hypothetical protein